MTREEWMFTLSRASRNVSEEIVDCVKHNISPPQEKLIAQEIINQIIKAL
jgi:hypothetical protein